MWEIIYLLILIAVVYGFVRGATSLAPWVPTSTKDYQRINGLINIQNKKFIDLGCGTAGLLIYLARKNPTGQFIGVEIALPLFIFAWCRIKLTGLTNIKLYYQDLFKLNLHDFDVIFVYGYPRSIKNRLATKIRQEVVPGTILISQAFKFHDLQPTQIDKPDNNHLPIFIYHF